MPAESIRELITQNLEATLLTVVAGPLYHHTIKKVVRSEEWSPNLDLYPAAMITLLDADESDAQSSTRQWVELRFIILGELEQWENKERDESRLIDDIKRVLLVDHLRGTHPTTSAPLAIKTAITRSKPLLPDGDMPHAGCTVEGYVRFRHLFGDPYTLA